jgi:hypothetical protein
VGATTHGTTVYVHESIVRADGVVRPWGAKLNLRQVIAHELGHAMALSDRTNCCYASSIGSGLDGLTFKERQGLFDDAVRIAPYEDVPVRLLGPPPDAEGAQSGGGTPARGPGELYQAHVSGEYGVLADLDQDGMLNLYIKAKPGVTPRGSEMFNDALNAFGPNVRGVRGTWLGGGDIADNFDSFKGLLSSGLSPEQAALGTFTGKMASRAGFSNVRVVMDTGSKVVVEFSR